MNTRRPTSKQTNRRAIVHHRRPAVQSLRETATHDSNMQSKSVPNRPRMSAASSAQPGPTSANVPSQGEPDPRRWLSFAVVLIAAFMILVDVSIVNVAIPSIQTELQATYAQVQFILAGYSLAYGVLLITGGRLGDIVGRKRMFMIGIGGFTLASALCGLAQSPQMLDISRIVQGAMAAMMYPQVFSILQVSFPPRERGTAFGIYGAVVGLGTIAGPLLGGFLTSANVFGWQWRSIFLVNLPIGIGAVIAAAYLLRESRSPRQLKLDIVGVIIISAALLLLVYPLVEGRDAGWPAWTFISLGAFPFVTAGFALFERNLSERKGDPLVNLNLFRNRAFVIGLAICLVFFSGVGAFFLVFSIALQTGLGYSPIASGLTTLPFAIGAFIGSTLSVRIGPRLGKNLLTIGAACLVLGMIALIFTFQRAGTGLQGYQATPALLLCGFGLGSVVAPLFNIILAGIPVADAGSASGVLTTTQQVGAALGIALIGVIFFGQIGSNANAASNLAVPALRQQLTSLKLPAPAVAPIIKGFQTCFYDRSNENDPSVVPASCQRGQAQGDPKNPLTPKIASAISHAANDAKAQNFVLSLKPALGYEIGVFSLTFLLIFLLPRSRQQEAGARPMVQAE